MSIILTYSNLADSISEALSRDYDFLLSPVISLLEVSENMTCLVNDGDKKYILQVNRPGYRTEEELDGEFEWLNMLSDEAGINTAIVYKGINGRVLQQFISPDGKKLYYSLQSFLEGKKLCELNPDLILEQMEKVGETAARLHLQSTKMSEHELNIRGLRWDLDDIVSPEARWGYYKNYGSISPETLAILENIEVIIRRRLENYGRDKGRYGLIHADIHANNLLVNNGIIYIIDFDDCGYGWFLYDLGSAVSKFSDGLPEIVASLIKGYERIRNLSEEDRQIIPTMIMMRRLARIGWMTTHNQKGVSNSDEIYFIEKTCEIAEKYINENRI